MSDIKHIMNGSTSSLVEELIAKLREVKPTKLDIVVGYFNIGGFDAISKYIPQDCKIRLLVGMSDNNVITERELNSLKTSSQYSDAYLRIMRDSIEKIDDRKEVNGVLDFVSKFKKRDIEIHVARNDVDVHAKVYMMYGRNKNCMFSGSSNLTYNGLKRQIEFNTLENTCDSEVNEWFEELWKNSIAMKADRVEPLKNTWIDPNIELTLEQVRMKFILETYKESINNVDDIDFSLLDGSGGVKRDRLEYQVNAVSQASYILDEYNGVFLADVVGLGKTFMGAMLLKVKDFSSCVILCKENLIAQWKEDVNILEIPNCTVMKYGNVLKNPSIIQGAECVLIDESQNFRNRHTNYKKLASYMYGKKVILVSATPQNNSLFDLENQLMLFTNMYNSNIGNIPNLKQYFNEAKKILGLCDRFNTEALIQFFRETKPDIERLNFINSIVQEVELIQMSSLEPIQRSIELRRVEGKLYNYFNKMYSEKLSIDILSHIMIRRTREDIQRAYKNDVGKFPKVNEVENVRYDYERRVSNAYLDIIEKIPLLYFASYNVKNYSKNEADTDTRIGVGIMKVRLVKRLDSSFRAFESTLNKLQARQKEMYNAMISGKTYNYKRTNGEEIEIGLSDLKSDFIEHLKYDIGIIDEMLEDVKAIQSYKDWKIDALADLVHELTSKRNRYSSKYGKVIIFTESEVTCNYIAECLSHKIVDSSRLLAVSSSNVKNHTKRIKDNFTLQGDGTNKADDLDILITTDIFSEGINMQYANIVINYDIPWNPTILIQRSGRVNRLDTEFKEIFIYNMQSTDLVRSELSQDTNVITKLNAFKIALGDDMKYLLEQDDIERITDLVHHTSRINNDSLDLEVKYRAEIAHIKNTDKDYFDRLLKMPNKLNINLENNQSKKNYTLVILKVGGKKIIYKYENGKCEPISIKEAIKLIDSKLKNTKEVVNCKTRTYEMYEARKLAIEHYKVTNGFIVNNVEKTFNTTNVGLCDTLIRELEKAYRASSLNVYEREKMAYVISRIQYGYFNDIIVENIIKDVKVVQEDSKVSNKTVAIYKLLNRLYTRFKLDMSGYVGDKITLPEIIMSINVTNRLVHETQESIDYWEV